MNFFGLHVGHSTLYGVGLDSQGLLLGHEKARFGDLEQLGSAYETVVASLQEKAGHCGQDIWTLALEKPHRLALAPRNRMLPGPKFSPTVVQPALSAAVLGAVPSSPSLLINLGREVRLALIDATHTFREYRITDGGGLWWQTELPNLAVHSQRLQTHLNLYPQQKAPLRELIRLLELGEFPTPDPVLKPKLEKVAFRLSDMALTLVAKLPGLNDYTLGGFLAHSALGRLIVENINKRAPQFKRRTPRFPPEVGAALTSLALDKENWELDHLGKSPFSLESEKDEWRPPKALVRRLYKLRKPFEHYPGLPAPGCR